MNNHIDIQNLSPENYKKLQTVAKILSRTQASGAFTSEAEVALSKAQAMLREMNLEIAQFESLNIDPTQRQDAQRVEDVVAHKVQDWSKQLWMLTGAINNTIVTTVFRRMHKKKIIEDRPTSIHEDLPGNRELVYHLFGRKHNVIATYHMATYLEKAIIDETRNETRNKFGGTIRGYRARAYRNGLLLGLTNRMIKRYSDIMPAHQYAYWTGKIREETTSSDALSSSTDLILTNFGQSEFDRNIKDHPDQEAAQREKDILEFVYQNRQSEARMAAEQEQKYMRLLKENPKAARKMAADSEAKKKNLSMPSSKRTSGKPASKTSTAESTNPIPYPSTSRSTTNPSGLQKNCPDNPETKL